MINPFQLVVNVAVIAMLGFTHFQAFKLGRTSVDNIFTRWLGNSSESCVKEESDPEKLWYEKFFD